MKWGHLGTGLKNYKSAALPSIPGLTDEEKKLALINNSWRARNLVPAIMGGGSGGGGTAPSGPISIWEEGGGVDSSARGSKTYGSYTYIFGNFYTAENILSPGLVRVDSNGIIDETFSSNWYSVISSSVPTIYDVTESNGSLFIATSNNTKRLIKLDASTGLEQPLSGLTTQPNNIIYQIIPYIDGTLLLIGNFTTYNGLSRTRVTRISQYGDLDAQEFGSGFNNTVYGGFLNDEDNFVIWGNFATYNGTSSPRLMELTLTGTTGEITGKFRTGLTGTPGRVQQLTNGNYIIWTTTPNTYDGNSTDILFQTDSSGAFISNANSIPGNQAINGYWNEAAGIVLVMENTNPYLTAYNTSDLTPNTTFNNNITGSINSPYTIWSYQQIQGSGSDFLLAWNSVYFNGEVRLRTMKLSSTGILY